MTPTPPYYAVIFTSTRSDDQAGYAEAAARMEQLAAEQEGFLGIDSVDDGARSITVSYWTDEDAIRAWRRNAEHQEAQLQGRERWYAAYSLRVARVERERDSAVE